MTKKSLILFLAGSLLLSSFNDLFSQERTTGKKFVDNAKRYLNIEYRYGGRLTKSNPGLDCLGLLFLAYQGTFNINWRKISVNPSKIIKDKQLGKPVKGLDGILSKDVDISKLEEGDIIYLLDTYDNGDKPLANLNKIYYWPWHTGIYSNKEKNLFLEANPGNKVIEHDFENILKYNKAIFVTRF